MDRVSLSKEARAAAQPQQKNAAKSQAPKKASQPAAAATEAQPAGVPAAPATVGAQDRVTLSPAALEKKNTAVLVQGAAAQGEEAQSPEAAQEAETVAKIRRIPSGEEIMEVSEEFQPSRKLTPQVSPLKAEQLRRMNMLETQPRIAISNRNLYYPPNEEPRQPQAGAKPARAKPASSAASAAKKREADRGPESTLLD